MRWLRRRARRSRFFSGSSSRDRFFSRASRAQAARFTVDKLYNSTGIWCAPARTAHRTRDRRRFHTFPPPLALLLLTGCGQLMRGFCGSILPAGACQRARSRRWRGGAHGRATDAPMGVYMYVPLRDMSREWSEVSRVPLFGSVAMAWGGWISFIRSKKKGRASHRKPRAWETASYKGELYGVTHYRLWEI